MSGPSMPHDAPALMRNQAELQERRFADQQEMARHDRSIQATASASGVTLDPPVCPCSFCRRVRGWEVVNG